MRNEYKYQLFVLISFRPPCEVQSLGKSEFWEKKSLDNTVNLLLDVSVCSIAVYFYSLFTGSTTHKNRQRYYTPKHLLR